MTNRFCNWTFYLVVCLSTFRPLGASWIDPDTPSESRTTKSAYSKDKRKYELVFSDEFEQDGRNFNDGNDPRWTSLNKNDYTNEAMHFYRNDNAKTERGLLKIKTDLKDNAYRAFNDEKRFFFDDVKHVQSAMLQSWNKFCYTGGIVEISAKLPGSPRIGGLWPALWLLGNLARATYVGSSEFVWPYSYNQCDASNRLSQAISACSRVHHYGLQDYRGRGAPEIDLIEAMQGDSDKMQSTTITKPYQSCSYQVAPGTDRDRPILGELPRQGHWYSGMEYNNSTINKSELNPFFYGVHLKHTLKAYSYQTDALSANRGLNSSHYTSQHKYRLEWEPPEEDGSGGHIRWYTDDDLVYGVAGSILHKTGTEIPSEPMYLLMNTAVAPTWGFTCPEGCTCECLECGNPDCSCALPTGFCENLPASFDIDYVRVFQAVGEEKHIVGCSPENRPTSLYIKGHQKFYMEDGDTSPLQPIQKGGARCREDDDCGLSRNGKCSSRGVCVCKENYTGPTCLAHSGFYVNESKSDEKSSLGWNTFYMPASLLAWIATLFIFLLFSAYLSRQDRIKFDTNHLRVEQSNAIPSTYQNSSEYALPPKQKVVTYCVVDGRLIDK